METSRPDFLLPDSRLARKPGMFASEIDNELVMMDDSLGVYFGLNPVGRLIWEGLETPSTYGSLIDKLVASHGVEIEQCRADVRPFLIKMIVHGLIRIEAE